MIMNSLFIIKAPTTVLLYVQGHSLSVNRMSLVILASILLLLLCVCVSCYLECSYDPARLLISLGADLAIVDGKRNSG